MTKECQKIESETVRNSFKTSTALWFGGMCSDEKGGKDIGNNVDANAQTDYWGVIERQE